MYRVEFFFILFLNFYPTTEFADKSGLSTCKGLSLNIGIDARRGVTTCNDLINCDEVLGGFMSVVTNIFSCK